jgi:hypothetical protein
MKSPSARDAAHRRWIVEPKSRGFDVIDTTATRTRPGSTAIARIEEGLN